MESVKKHYLNAQDFLRDTWRLGRLVLDSGWQPDWLVGLWRGGAEVGVSVHEFLHVHGLSPRHLSVKCSSYTGIGQQDAEVKFEYAEAFFEDLKAGTKVLVLDDVFDSGRTAAAVRARIESRGAEMRFGCVYWKPDKNLTPYTPDFHVRILNEWIVFPHEIEGLTPEEIRMKDPELAAIF